MRELRKWCESDNIGRKQAAAPSRVRRKLRLVGDGGGQPLRENVKGGAVPMSGSKAEERVGSARGASAREGSVELFIRQEGAGENREGEPIDRQCLPDVFIDDGREVEGPRKTGGGNLFNWKKASCVLAFQRGLLLEP